MKLSSWVGMTKEELRRGARRSAMIGVGLVVGVAALVYFLALGKGVKGAVAQKLTMDLPAEEILVNPQTTDVGPIRLNRSGIFSGARKINDGAIEKIKNIKIEYHGDKIKPVKEIWRRMDAAFPASVSGDLLGISYGTDTAISGVDAGMVLDDVQKGEFKYSTGEDNVPTLVPEALLEVYNSSFARAQGLPGLNPTFLLGRHFTLNLGASSLSSSSSARQRGGVIVGLTRRGTLLGVIVPIEYVVDWNRTLGPDGAEKEYGSLVVHLTDSKYVPKATEAINALGFSAGSNTGLAERVAGIITMITAGLGLIAGVILLVAGLNAWGLFKLAAWERRSVAGLWMALGASPNEVRSLLISEAVVVGAASGIVGAVIAAIACGITNYAAGKAAVSIPLFPTPLAVLTVKYALAGIAAAALIAVVAAFPSASKLAKTEPADILARER